MPIRFSADKQQAETRHALLGAPLRGRALFTPDGILDNAIVYAAIHYLSNAVITIPVRIEAADGAVLPRSDKAYGILRRPNQSQTFADIMRAAVVNYCLFGDAYIATTRRNGVVSGLYVQRSDMVYHLNLTLKDEQRTLVGYRIYQNRGDEHTAVNLLPQDVVHIRAITSYVSHDGYSAPPLLPVRRAVSTDNDVGQLLEEFFENGTISSIALHYPMPLDSETIDEIQQRWNSLFAGQMHWFAPLVIDSGGTLERVGLQIEDLAPLRHIDARDESRIVSVLGVPLNLITSRPDVTQSTYSNKQIDREDFMVSTLFPLINIIQAAFDAVDWGTGWRIVFDVRSSPTLASIFDPYARMIYQTFVAGGATINELRESVGLHPYADETGKWRGLPLNMAFIDDNGKTVSGGGYNVEAPQDVDASLSARRGLTFAYEGYDPAAYANFIWLSVSSYEPDVFANAEFPMNEERRVVMRKVREAWERAREDKNENINIEDILAAAALASAKRWMKALGPVLDRIATSVVRAAASRFGPSIDIKAFLESQEWRNYKLTFSDPLTETAQREIKALLERALHDGYSADDVEESLETLFRQWVYGDVVNTTDRYFAKVRLPDYRRAMIARTETVRAANMAQFWYMINSGVQFKEWIAVHDNKTRDTHRIGRAWGEPYIVEVNEPFIIGGYPMMYPGDPSAPAHEVVNCRCVVVPARNR